MKDFFENASLFGIIIIILIPVFLFVGWFKNLVTFVELDFKEPYKAEIIRGVGLTPLGGVIGWLKIEDK